MELRLTKRVGSRWYGSVQYTYSKLRGNYAGLTNTDPTDGGGGRHSPNNGRAFDIPTMSYTPSGKPDDGPLATDRPNTGKIFGYYRLPWFGQETLIGVSQLFYQGTPISACLPVVGTSSACQWAEGRGNMPRLVRNPDGSITQNGVVHDARTEPLFQTDLNLRHEFKLNKQRENLRLAFEATAQNLLNQHAAVGYYQFVIPTNLVTPTRLCRRPASRLGEGDERLQLRGRSEWNRFLRGRAVPVGAGKPFGHAADLPRRTQFPFRSPLHLLKTAKRLYSRGPGDRPPSFCEQARKIKAAL